MFYSVSGKLIVKSPQFIAVESNGVGFRIFIPSKYFRGLPKTGSKIRLFCSFVMNRERPEIYGFLNEQELEIFELLVSVSGIGPKSALGVLGKLKTDKLMAIINQERVDLLSKSWGIGRKKAQRIILELKDKIKKSKKEIDFSEEDSDKDLKSALKNLGYKDKEIKELMNKISFKSKKLEDKLKEVLKFISRK